MPSASKTKASTLLMVRQSVPKDCQQKEALTVLVVGQSVYFLCSKQTVISANIKILEDATPYLANVGGARLFFN